MSTQDSSRLSLTEPLGRRGYILSVILLGALRLAGYVLLTRILAGQWLSPAPYRSSRFGVRLSGIENPETLTLLTALWGGLLLAVGAALATRRLTDAGLSRWLVLLFFVPFVSLPFLLALSLSPSARELPSKAADARLGRNSEPPPPGSRRRTRQSDDAPFDLIDQDLPLATAGGLATGLLIFGACHTIGVPYGLALFMGTPFAVGIVTGLLFSKRAVRTVGATALASFVPIFFLAVIFLVSAIEGAICLLMAAPLAMAQSSLGAIVGRALVAMSYKPVRSAMVLIVLSPSAVGLEPERVPPLRSAITTVEIDAPPEVVWGKVVAFSELPPPSDLIFRAGIAYPMRAEIRGSGVGAVRHCVFSTGAFVEPITVWDEPNRLAFDVIDQPPTMQEWSPYREIKPAHLLEGLDSERGEFRLERLPDGGTRLTGTTWYRSHLYPQVYWGAWTDLIIHRIHQRVLDHIRAEAEATETSLRVEREEISR